MLRRLTALGATASLLSLLACSSSDGTGTPGSESDPDPTTTDGPPPEGDYNDVRVEIPEADATMMDFATVDLTIPAGEERQWCVFMTSPSEGVYVQSVEQLQGDGGHHAILMTTDTEAEDGTVVDCTNAEDMADYSLTLLPLDLPDGYAQFLPGGTRLVLQSHYVNATAKPLLARDVVRLHTVTEAEVVTPTAPLATHHYDVDMPAQGSRDFSFDCEMDRDADLITVGGHMHEEGTAFSIELGTGDGSFETIYSVPEWDAEYRDSPPIDVFTANPIALHTGDILRTNCSWANTRAEAIGWPVEMCAGFGLITGSFEPYECNLGYRE